MTAKALTGMQPYMMFPFIKLQSHPRSLNCQNAKWFQEGLLAAMKSGYDLCSRRKALGILGKIYRCGSSICEKMWGLFKEF